MNSLTDQQVLSVAEDFGTPTFVYDELELRSRARAMVEKVPSAFGLTVRYAVKANPNAAILRIFDKAGLHFDASSHHEARRIIAAGIDPKKIQLTSQELDQKSLEELVAAGVRINVCSLHQLGQMSEAFLSGDISVRINPPQGSGAFAATITGGGGSSFGIWYEYIPEIQAVARRANFKIDRLHLHIGSGADPETWKQVATLGFGYVKLFPEVTTLNLGGGFKVKRVDGEKETNIYDCMALVANEAREFYDATGRKIDIEIEPGTYMVAHAGTIVAKVVDVKRTTPGHNFLIVNSGMTENARVALYGARHPMRLVAGDGRYMDDATTEYSVSGHCCESGDTWGTVVLPEARVGDFLLMGETGAYCAAMSMGHYNSYPEAAEVLDRGNGIFDLIRKREDPADLYRNEVRPTKGEEFND